MRRKDKVDPAEAGGATETTEVAKPKSKKKKLLMLVALMLLMSAGAGGYVMLGGGGDAAEEKPKPVAGAVVSLESITINLSDGHYLKIGIALQTTAEVEEEPDGAKALDVAIDQFSEYSMGELSSTEGRHEAKAKLRERVTEAYEGEIMDVYFTEFVMQ